MVIKWSIYAYWFFKYLSDNGYTTLFADEYEQAYSTYKPVILTFDDGYEDNYIELFPLLKTGRLIM